MNETIMIEGVRVPLELVQAFEETYRDWNEAAQKHTQAFDAFNDALAHEGPATCALVREAIRKRVRVTP